MNFLLVPYLAAHLVAGAPVKVEIHYMPPGEKIYLPSAKGWGKGFSLEEYKVLLQMDNDLYHARQQLKLMGDLKLKWHHLLEEKDKIITTVESDRDTYKERSERLKEKWGQCEEDLVDAAGGEWWPYVLAAVGAAVGLLGTGLFLGGQLSTSN
jgi:hypothetical protein